MTVAGDSFTLHDQPSQFALECASCSMTYDALQSEWCQCIVRERTLVCPRCRQCFCRADLDYKRSVWMSAPEVLWSRKQQAAREHSVLPENPLPENVRRPLVLVVDDDPEIRALATHLIDGWGFGCIHAANGTDGLTSARRYRPELILTDALMPRMDGRELCRLVKADPQLSGTRVVIMSSVYTSGRFKREALSHFKADEYLAKPVDASMLYRLIRPAELELDLPARGTIVERTEDSEVPAASTPEIPRPFLRIDWENDVALPVASVPETPEPLLSTGRASDMPLPSAAAFLAMESVPQARLRLTARELIRLRALGLDAELAALGNAAPDLRTLDLVVARTAGVPFEFLRALDPELLTTLTAADVIKLHSAGCPAQAINVLRRLEFQSGDIIGITATGVSLDFIEALVRVAERPLRAEELIRLHAAGVEIDYIRSVKASGGTQWSVDDWIRLWTLGVTPDFIRGASDALSSECSIGELLQLWLSGIDVALLDQVREGI